MGAALMASGTSHPRSCLCDRDDPHLAGSSDGQPVRALSPARLAARRARSLVPDPRTTTAQRRSEEHTSELQSLMRISYAVFCLKKKNNKQTQKTQQSTHTMHKIKDISNKTI